MCVVCVRSVFENLYAFSNSVLCISVQNIINTEQPHSKTTPFISHGTDLLCGYFMFTTVYFFEMYNIITTDNGQPWSIEF